MPSRPPPLSLSLLAAALALATGGAWAQQDGRGQGRADQGRGDQSRGDRERGNQGAAQMRAQRLAQPQALPAVTPPPRPPRNDALAEAVRRIERSTRGRVISAERMQSDGRDINRIKVMDDRGRVRVYTDDPQQRGRPPTRGDDN